MKVVQEKIFKPSLTYLADIFEALNMLNLKLQGPHTTIILHTDAIKAFIAKLGLWERKIKVVNIAAFHCLTQIMGEKPLKEQLQKEIKNHMSIVQKKFYCYFHDINAIENVQMTLAHNPFCCTVDDLPDNVQKNFLDLFNNTAAKEDFYLQQLRISDFWAKMLPIFPKISEFT